MMDNNINIDHGKIKRDMKELWKDTFHDSSRYIDLVFDTYFNRNNIFVRYDENRLIASMLCIPYEFQILSKEGDKRLLQGVYLCGLATLPEFRRKGIMAEMMAEAEEEWRKRGFDLAFLIPADSHLREYYGRKGYVTSSFRKNHTYTNHPTESSEEEKPELYIYTIKGMCKSGEKGRTICSMLADWCREIELHRNGPTLIHSKRDLMTVMAENENSIFLTKGPLNLKNPILANIAAVAFPELSESPDRQIRIVGLYLGDSEGIDTENMQYSDRPNENATDLVYNRAEMKTEIFKSILRFFNCESMELCTTYEGECYNGTEIEPYAMVKSLRKIEYPTVIDSLKFEISLMLD